MDKDYIAQKATADASFDQYGSAISEGKKKSRIYLAGMRNVTSPNSSQVDNRTLIATASLANRLFASAATLFGKKNIFTVTIRLPDNRGKVEVNFNSFCKRLHFTGDIDTLIDGEGEIHLDQINDHLESINTILSDYQQKVDDWGSNFPTEKDLSETSSFTRETVMKVITIAVKEMNKASNSSEGHPITGGKSMFEGRDFTYYRAQDTGKLWLIFKGWQRH